MKNIFKVLLFMIFTFVLFMPMQMIVKASTFASMSPKTNVEAVKPWTVSFNKPLTIASVNTKNIKVIGEGNKSVEVKVDLANANKNVIVQPVKNYEYNKTYTLIITQNVTSTDGKPLPKEVRMNFSTKTPPTKPSEVTVCIDPAQYYTENTGAGGAKATDINLSIAVKLGNILKTRGFNVVYTRDGNSVPWSKVNENDAKATIVKNSKADVFLSININSASNLEAQGIETYYVADSSNMLLASSMQEELIKATDATNRGIKLASETANFEILRKTSCPSVVLELGFLSNPEEEKMLSSTAYQNNAAKAIANGLMNYAGLKNTDTNYESVLKVTSVPDIKVNLEQGGKYNFPKTLQATMSNNLKKEVQVQWPLDIVYLTEVGTYTYEGIIKDYDKKVKAVIQVSKKQTGSEEPVYINDIVENIKKGDNYSFPSKVIVVTDKGEEKEVDIVWDNNELDTSKAGAYTFIGTIVGRAIKVNLLINVTEPSKSSYKVVLDPGHGGNDSGAVGAKGTKEKDVVLAITLKVGNILVKNGVETIYTRISDKTQSLQQKCDVSNTAKPDFFVSIHANSYTSSTVSGIETFYSSGNAAGLKLAQAVQGELIKETGRVDRKVKTAGFYVLNNTDATAILVETSFLSNPEEERLLGTNAYQDKLAKAISTGILKSLGITNIIY